MKDEKGKALSSRRTIRNRVDDRASPRSLPPPADGSEPQSWPALVWRFFRTHPVLLIACVILALAVFLITKLEAWPAMSKAIGLHSGIIRSDKPFEILAVTVLVREVDLPGHPAKERHTTVRSLYTIRGIKGISESADAMVKRYTKSEAREIRLWGGTVHQITKSQAPTDIETTARFRAEPSELKTLVYGAEVIFDLPLKNDPPRGIGDVVIMQGEESWWAYPNYDGMVIPIVSIIVESPSHSLKLPPSQAAARVKKNRDVDYGDALVGPQEMIATQGALWATWRDVQPHEIVALKWLPENK